MTLYRQLIIFTLSLFIVLFTGTWLAMFESTRSFLINQLESHAQDGATSLGLVISQYAAKNDRASMDSMINAVFDSGYYQTIKFTNMEGKVVKERHINITVESVPSWFIVAAPLSVPEANVNVMAGWRQVGMIYVKSHPGYAYYALWHVSLKMIIWFTVCSFVGLLVGGLGLRVLLRPLVLVQQQADAICKKKYEIQERLPRTREFRQVVIAMNQMSSKVKEMFEEQAAFAEGFRDHAYHDSVTGLGNRRYFEVQMQAQRDEQREGIAAGILFLIQIHELQQLNQLKGRQAGDDLLKVVALVLKDMTQPYANAVLARLTGGDFSVFLPDAPPWDAAKMAADMANALSGLAVQKITASDNVAHIGAVTYDVPMTIGSLLSESDMALRTAQQKGPNAWHVRAITMETESLPAGEQQWKSVLEAALQARRIRIDVQPAVRTADRNDCLHIEVFSKIIREDGGEFRAENFLPFAERLGLIPRLDRIVLEEVMRLDYRQLRVGAVAVNISSNSLSDDAFRQWLYTALKALPESAPRLTFEFAEFGAIRNLDLVKKFRDDIKELGHSMALDHYGQSLSKLGYLQSLRPDYVKVDRAYTEELKNAASDSRFYMGSLCSVAHSIDIIVIAEGVETEEQFQLLRELNIDGMQGYVISRPKPIAEYLKEN